VLQTGLNLCLTLELELTMNYIIFDLEATCWEHPRPTHKQEIIEIGAVLVDEYAHATAIFNEFIQPIYHPTLSPFCKELTSIQQEDVAQAKLFPEVIEAFQEWIGYFDDEEYLLCSWGFFDKKILINNCDLHQLDDEWLDPHISVKHQYKDVKKLSRAIGLKRAVEKEGFEFTGTHHRGIDDAHNLAKVFGKYFDEWVY